MKGKNAQDVMKKWSANLRNAKTSMEAGVRAVQVAPTMKAAQKADKYVAGVAKAVEEGRFQRGLQKVSLADWQQAMITKGIGRLDGGVRAAEGNFEAFMSQWLPFVQNVQQQVDSMPNDTEDQRDQRMLENVRRLRQFKRT